MQAARSRSFVAQQKKVLEHLGFELFPIGGGLYAAVVTFTPELAEAALKKRGDLWRKLKERKVEEYGTMMLREGGWRLDGSPIRLKLNGDLIDGQHRLTASIRTGKSFTTVIVCGPIEQHPQMDTGVSRTLVDWLRREGHTSCTDLAALIRLHYMWNVTGRDLSKSKGRAAPAHETLLDVFEDNPGIVDAIHFGIKVYSRAAIKGLIARSWISHLHYLFSTEGGDEELSTEFWNSVSDPHTQEDMHILLRMTLLRMHEQVKRAGVMKNPVSYYALTIKTWNAWVTDSPMKALRYRAVGEKKEPFPKIVNSTTYSG